MKFSYDWLKDLSGYKGSAKELAELLSLHSCEAEIVGKQSEFEKIIVAKVLKVEKHPNADRLRVVTLTDGHHTISPVVCGAWNFEAGAIVALALPGAIIPHDQHDPEGKPFTLTKATIRGIESQGMICSGKELGLSDDGSGILVLDPKYKIGDGFSAEGSAPRGETLDVSTPANRPDLLSYRGLAFEILALSGSKYQGKSFKFQVSSFKSKILKVRIADSKLCQRYLAVRLGSVQIKDSPEFIKKRLEASGMRSRNNVVDITNYVMLETGQPLHAFDGSLVVGAISVRKAYVNESLQTLDKANRKLTSDMLVIADSKKALAIAGVMGGTESEVSSFTTELILESANFNAISIRKTSRNLGLRSEASARFEKSLPLQLTDEAAKYASELLIKYAGAKVLEYVEAGSKIKKPTTVEFDPEKVNQLLGTNIPAAKQKQILKRFGFRGQGSGVRVQIPFWRPDVTIWQDLAEEVARFESLDKIPSTTLQVVASSAMSDPMVDARDHVTDLLVGMGFDETYTYSFTEKSFPDSVEVANPLSSDQQFLRKRIGMNYKAIIERNSEIVDHQNLFEIGNVFWKQGNEVKEQTNLFMLCFSKHKVPADVLMTSAGELFRRLGQAAERKQTSEQAGELYLFGKKIGDIVSASEEKVKWAALELNFEELVGNIKLKQFKSISHYPSRDLDVSVLVREDLPWFEIKKIVHSEPLVYSVELLEVYHGKGIAPGKKSLTFRTVYQDLDRTLTSSEVDKIHSQILANLRSKLNAQIRD